MSSDSRFDAALLDLDGTLYQDDAPLPGAVAAVATLRRDGVPLRFVTNTTRRPRAEVARRLRDMGFEVADDELLTPAAAAARWLAQHATSRIRLYAPEELRRDFTGIELDAAEPDAVVVADLGAAWDWATLNRAFRELLRGARLVALQRNRYWRSGGELVLDAGPFVAALEYAAGVEAVVVGKPSAAFFELACAGLDARRVAMVGDDVESDVRGARAAGLGGILVRTGKFTDAALAASGVAPDAVIDSVADLPALLRR